MDRTGNQGINHDAERQMEAHPVTNGPTSNPPCENPQFYRTQQPRRMMSWAMRSTQFDDQSTLEEKPEEHRESKPLDTLCETIKRLGYAQNNQVRLYGDVFDLVSDPVSVGGNFVYVDAVEQKSNQLRRVRIPLTIVQMARTKRRAA